MKKAVLGATYAVAVIMFVLPLAISQQAGGQEKKGEHEGMHAGSAKVVCPVSGKPIDRQYSTKYKGKDVYFCCPNCKPTFEKDPAKYEAAVNKQWEAIRPLSVQVKCPGTGKAVNPKVFVESDHGKVYFCCADCKAAWQKDGGKAMQAKLAASYTYQTACPVTGEEIDPTASVQQDGKTVYFCCGDCIDKFKAEPAKFMKNVDEQIAANKAVADKLHEKQPEKKADKQPEKKGG